MADARFTNPGNLLGNLLHETCYTKFCNSTRSSGRTVMKGHPTKGIGLAIVGAGRVGLFRGEVAARHPAVEWIGIAERNPNRGSMSPRRSAPISSPPTTGSCSGV